MRNKILGILKEVLEDDNISQTTRQNDCENWNSLRQLSLASELESEFDIELEPDEIAEMTDFEKIVSIIEEKTK